MIADKEEKSRAKPLLSLRLNRLSPHEICGMKTPKSPSHVWKWCFSSKVSWLLLKVSVFCPSVKAVWLLAAHGTDNVQVIYTFVPCPSPHPELAKDWCNT